MKLWLDDIREPPTIDEWRWYLGPWDALKFVINHGHDIDEWSLDHDLGVGVPSGYMFLDMIYALLMNGHKIHVPDKITAHSMNPVGRANMEAVLEAIKRDRK